MLFHHDPYGNGDRYKLIFKGLDEGFDETSPNIIRLFADVEAKIVVLTNHYRTTGHRIDSNLNLSVEMACTLFPQHKDNISKAFGLPPALVGKMPTKTVIIEVLACPECNTTMRQETDPDARTMWHWICPKCSWRA